MNLEYWRTYVDEIEATPVEALLGKASPAVRTALERSLLKRELTPEEGLLLYTSEGDDLRATVKCADLARAEDIGNEVTYVVNRNINFTNICFVGCQFCGFKRQRWEADAYDHSDETIVRKVADAVARGAT
jgi:2-iminoacetate synthase ThiH